jgi:hypothetical protein
MKALANLFLFFAVLPFISPLPTESDVQLPAFVFGLLILARDVAHDRARFDWVDLAFVCVAIWSFFYVLPGGEFVLRTRIGLLMAFIIFYVAKRHAALFSPKTVYAAIVLNFVATLVQWLRPDVFALMIPYMVRTLKAIEQNRGFSGLSAEPSFLAAMAVVQGMLMFYFYRAGRTRRGTFVTAGLMALATILLSRSATGFAYLLIACVIYLLYFAIRGLRPSVWFVFLASGAVAIALMVGPLATTRGGAIVVSLYENPGQVVTDGAIQERAASLSIGVLSVPDNLLGWGGGGFSAAAAEVDQKYHLEKLFPYANPAVLGGVLSSGGLYLAECGVVFIAFLYVIFKASLRFEVFHLLFCTMAFLFILVSFSIAFPLTWLLLGLAERKDRFGPLPAARRLSHA